MNGYQAVKAALYTPGLTTSQKMVLVALADHVGDDGAMECRPGMSRLKELTSLSKPTIVVAIRELETMGLLTVLRAHGQGNRYRLMLETGKVILPVGPETGKATLPVANETGKATLPVHLEGGKASLPVGEGTGKATLPVLDQTGKATLPEHNKNTTTTIVVADRAATLERRFTEITALDPPHDTTDFYRDKWQAFFVWLIERFPADAEARMEAAIEVLRAKRYTIKWPDSLRRTCANWQPPADSTAGIESNAEAAFELVMQQIHLGRWGLSKDGPELAAVRQAAGSWPAAMNIEERDLPHFKRRFLSAYSNGGQHAVQQRTP